MMALKLLPQQPCSLGRTAALYAATAAAEVLWTWLSCPPPLGPCQCPPPYSQTGTTAPVQAPAPHVTLDGHDPASPPPRHHHHHQSLRQNATCPHARRAHKYDDAPWATAACPSTHPQNPGPGPHLTCLTSPHHNHLHLTSLTSLPAAWHPPGAAGRPSSSVLPPPQYNGGQARPRQTNMQDERRVQLMATPLHNQVHSTCCVRYSLEPCGAAAMQGTAHVWDCFGGCCCCCWAALRTVGQEAAADHYTATGTAHWTASKQYKQKRLDGRDLTSRSRGAPHANHLLTPPSSQTTLYSDVRGHVSQVQQHPSGAAV